MILGIGTDIVNIARIEKALSQSQALARRVLTDNEWEEFSEANHPARYLAKKFASKEATVKAIGTGIGNGMGWQCIQISHDTLGKPLVEPQGAFKQWCADNQVSNVQISIADEQEYACAFVIIER